MFAMPSINWQATRRMRVMTHAFFDDADTTHQGSGMLIMAGLVASDAQFQNLHDDWVKQNRLSGLAAFHAADFLAGKGKYRAASMGHAERIGLAEKLLGVAAQHVSFAVVVAVDRPQMKATLQGVRAAGGQPTPYSFLMNRLFRRCLDEIRSQGGAVPLYPTFDDSEREAQGILGGYHQALRNNPGLRSEVASICFADDQHVVPIQAADLLACAALRKWRPDGPCTDGLLDQFAFKCPLISEIWDAAEIRRRDQEIRTAMRAPVAVEQP